MEDDKSLLIMEKLQEIYKKDETKTSKIIEIEESQRIIDSYNINPVIINKDSKFVIITYWWGRKNKNNNTKKPCDTDTKKYEINELDVQPIKFEEMIEKWKEYCINANCNYLVQEYPEFTRPGGYQLAINAKPLFIQKALESCGGRAVVYIDGDMTVNKYPHIFDMDNVDYMARGWNIDPRGNSKYLSKICFDPFTFETSGGIMYFANSPDAKDLLTMWKKYTSRINNKGKADDRILSLLVHLKKLYISMNILQLPIEYLWLTDYYQPQNPINKYLNDSHYNKNDIIIEHPACLTSEDTATALGAASDRQPKHYHQLENDINCDTEGGIFYEHIIFENMDQSAPWAKYLRYISKATIYKDEEGTAIKAYYYTPYRSVYGNKNDIAINNIEKAQDLSSSIKDIKFKKNIVKIIESDQIYYNDAENILYTTDLIPTILILYNLKISVVYLPHPTNYYINTLYKIQKNKKYELVAYISNEDENYPKFDTMSPIYLNCKSRILYHIIKISKNMEDFNKNLKSCALFIQLIRCNFLMYIDNPVSVSSRPKSLGSIIYKTSTNKSHNTINALLSPTNTKSISRKTYKYQTRSIKN